MQARLSKTDWLEHGLRELAKSGYPVLKADSLCKALNVSRGSFYWHFQDVGQFHIEVLALWRQRTTDVIIEEVNQLATGERRLKELIRKAIRANNNIEWAVRSWAAHSEIAATAVRRVDRVRLNYLRKLLRTAGVDEEHVAARATFIYWASLGRLMMGKVNNASGVKQLDAIADLFLAP